MVHGQPVITMDGWSRSGVQNEGLQLSQNISYADLNLATRSGAKQLQARVRDAANTICQKLDNYDPPSTAIESAVERVDCINSAVDSAMPKVRQAVASAEQAHRG
jgi:UrcA family protein